MPSHDWDNTRVLGYLGGMSVLSKAEVSELDLALEPVLASV